MKLNDYTDMKKIIILLTAFVAWCGSALADGLTVQSISIPKGGEATLVIALENTTMEFTAFQFDVQLAEGITVSTNDKGKLAYERGARLDEDFRLSMSQPDPEANSFRVLGYYEETVAISGTNGAIISIKLKADASLETGTSHECKLTGINLTETDGTKHKPADITFNVTIKATEYTILDENSTTTPEASDGEVDVKVKRTIKANEWSTLVLPFDMTEEQVKEAFGDDVQLAEFTDYEADYDDNDNVTGLTVNFEATDLTEGFYGNYPYLVKTTKDISEFIVTATVDPDESEAVAEYDNGRTGKNRKVYGSLIGTYHAGDAIPANGLFLNGNKFYYSTGKTKIKAFRAYFMFNDVLSSTGAEAKMRIIVDEEPTTINGIDGTDIIQGAIYNVNGQLVGKDLDVNTLPKGVYYVDGKKVAIY